MLDVSLLITIGVIFLITLVGAYLRSTRVDRCLRAWDGFHITLERTNSKVIWGVLSVASTGMELSYLNSIQDDKHIESSYLLYGNEYPEIQTIYRYADKLSESGRKRRARDIQRSFHPGPWHRLRRWLRNFFSTATDSLNEVLGIVLGRVQKSSPHYMETETASIKSLMGGKVFGQVGSVYDPLLEDYIGHRVVVELLKDAEVHEHVGVFKEYSNDFIEILDVQYPELQVLSLASQMQYESQQLLISSHNRQLQVTNCDERPILVSSIDGPSGQQLINAVVDSGETIDLDIQDQQLDQLKLHLQVVRELDMILPRTRCLVRHRAENAQKENLSGLVMDIVFDVGMALERDKTKDTHEARLRQLLLANPNDAVAAANLGSLLIGKDALAEAETWLRRALSAEYSLPDGGRRARMELREIERRGLEESYPLFGMGQARAAKPPMDDTAANI
jgi:hypothetical protein